MSRKKAAKFTCSKCGKKFGMAMHLGRHMTTIHGQASKAARPAKMAKTGVRKGRPPGRPAGVVGRLGLKNMSLDQLIGVISAVKEEASSRIAGIQATLFPTAPQGPARQQLRAAPRAVAVRKAQPTRRARRKFKVSGPESILAFVKGKGAKGAMTSEIVKNWKKQGRSGDGYTTLGELVKAKKLHREPLKDKKGSRYTVA